MRVYNDRLDGEMCDEHRAADGVGGRRIADAGADRRDLRGGRTRRLRDHAPPMILSSAFRLILPALLALGAAGGASRAAATPLPSDVSVHLAAAPSVGLLPGEPFTLTLEVVNEGVLPVPRVNIHSAPLYPYEVDLSQQTVDCEPMRAPRSRARCRGRPAGAGAPNGRARARRTTAAAPNRTTSRVPPARPRRRRHERAREARRNGS